ncbi:unnamed protein product [Effrenium voratum]|uniref:Uncharacterized protein n=1 Tax=Effrenium voratum TaxID=2562239 RepID=A0AA36JI28_9DINO|nr:unnamed protein product [Effrenium voratum]
MASLEEVQEALREEQAARQELEEALHKAAKYGQELLTQVQEQERTIQEYKDKEVDVTPQSQASPMMGRRSSRVGGRRSVTVANYPGENKRKGVGFALPGNTGDSDDEDGRLRPSLQRRPRGASSGKTVMVEDLMQHNQSLEDELTQLRQQLQEGESEDDDEEDEEEEDQWQGAPRPSRKSKKASENVMEEEERGRELQELKGRVEELQREQKELQAAHLQRIKELEADLETKKHETEELKLAEQAARTSAASSENRNKVLLEKFEMVQEEHDKTEKQLQLAKAKERDLEFQLEEQALRGKARSGRKWMPTACEEALRSAAGTSLADEFEGMGMLEEGSEDGDGGEEVSQAEAQESPESQESQASALRRELEEAQAAAARQAKDLEAAAAAAEANKEVSQALQLELDAAKAEAAKEREASQQALAAGKAADAAAADLRKQLEAIQADAGSGAAAQAEAQKEVQALHSKLQASEASQAEALTRLSELGQKLEAAAEVSPELAQAKAQLQAALAENSQLKEEIKTQATADGESAPETESFWNKVMGAIACARTPPKGAAGTRVTFENREPVRLAIPNE